MMKSCMIGTRKYQMTHAQLPNSPQALKIRMFNEVKQDIVWQGEEAIQGVVDVFAFVQVVKAAQNYREKLKGT